MMGGGEQGYGNPHQGQSASFRDRLGGYGGDSYGFGAMTPQRQQQLGSVGYDLMGQAGGGYGQSGGGYGGGYGRSGGGYGGYGGASQFLNPQLLQGLMSGYGQAGGYGGALPSFSDPAEEFNRQKVAEPEPLGFAIPENTNQYAALSESQRTQIPVHLREQFAPTLVRRERRQNRQNR